MSEVFGGEYSRDMWEKINKIQYEEVRDALNLICCRLQEFEDRLTTDKEPENGCNRCKYKRDSLGWCNYCPDCGRRL